MDYAETGIRNLATTELNASLTDSQIYPHTPEMLHNLHSNLNLSNTSNITLNFDGDTVKYSYALKEYKGPVTTLSDTMVHSSASCNAITVRGNKVHRVADNKTTILGVLYLFHFGLPKHDSGSNAKKLCRLLEARPT